MAEKKSTITIVNDKKKDQHVMFQSTPDDQNYRSIAWHTMSNEKPDPNYQPFIWNIETVVTYPEVQQKHRDPALNFKDGVVEFRISEPKLDSE